MNTKNIKSKIAVAVVGLVLSGALPLVAMAATPAITALSPSGANVGSGPITLTVNGNNFDTNAVVNVNGFARSTAYVSPTQLTAVIPASDLATFGTFSVTVNNPNAGGGMSAAQTFTVGNAVPAITSISSSSATAGSSGFNMTVNGSNFVTGSVVNFNGFARPTTYVSPTQLMVAIPTLDLVTAGSYGITVSNPAPGGGTSNTQTFTVIGSNNPIPSITSMLPISMVAGGGNFTLTVSGSNFNTSSFVRFNGIVRPTAYVSPNMVTAIIPASDIAITGGSMVEVANPAPGGGTSNAILFTTTPSSITPGLPNTGFGPQTNTSLLAIALTALVGMGLGLATRKLWLVKR